jgi:hypothetical protein
MYRLRQTLYLHMWDDADMFVHVHVQRRNIDPLTAKCKVLIVPAYGTIMGRTRKIYMPHLTNIHLKLIRPSRNGLVVTFQTPIREVLGSNLYPDIGCNVWGILCFFPSPHSISIRLQMICSKSFRIHLQYYHSTQYSHCGQHSETLHKINNSVINYFE